MTIDFALDVADMNMDEVELHRLAQLVTLQIRLQDKLESHSKLVKELEADLKKVQEEQIPALMAEIGLRSVKLENGAEVSIKKFYSANISEDRKAQAHQWLLDNGYGDLIKNIVSSSFVRGQEEQAELFAKELVERGLAVNVAKRVEAMTLKAWAREMVEKGRELPSELFGIYIGEKAKIEFPKRNEI